MGFLTRGRDDVPAIAAPRRRTAKRALEAAQLGRLVSSWVTQPTTLDREIRDGGAIAIARSRDLALNFDYFKRFLLDLSKNVVGPHGIRFRSRAMQRDGVTPDESLRALLQAAWMDWGKQRTCTTRETLDWVDVQRMAMQAVPRDGAFYLRLHRGRNLNRYGFAVEPIEATAIDFGYDRDLPNGRRIRMAIEFAPSSARPVAYHFLTELSSSLMDSYLFGGKRYLRVPAEDVVALVMQDFVTQTHGLPWSVSAVMRMRQMHGYEDAEIVAARTAAAKMGFWIEDQNTEGYDGDEDKATGERSMEAEPGLIETRSGGDFKPWDPQHPTTAFDPFYRAMVRGLASGLGLSYTNLGNDQKGGSYSSGRVDQLADQDYYRMLQAWLGRKLHDRVLEAWFDALSLTQIVAVSTQPDLALLQRQAKWMPRGWRWVDPLKDANGARIAYALGTTSIEQIVADTTGEDYEEVFRQRARERQLARELGLPIDTGGGTADLFGAILAAGGGGGSSED